MGIITFIWTCVYIYLKKTEEKKIQILLEGN